MINYTFIVDGFRIGGFACEPLAVRYTRELCKDFAYGIGHKEWLNIELIGEKQ